MRWLKNTPIAHVAQFLLAYARKASVRMPAVHVLYSIGKWVGTRVLYKRMKYINYQSNLQTAYVYIYIYVILCVYIFIILYTYSDLIMLLLHLFMV